MRFTKNNLNSIKDLFEYKTGARLPSREKRRRPLRTVLILAAVLACLGMTAFGRGAFTAADNDRLSLNAEYMGGGIVHVQVENRSNSVLEFQERLKLCRAYSDGEYIAPVGEPVFEHTEFAPHSSGTMVIDLSGAYDMAELEKPLADNGYVLVLTNSDFVFGQDWMTSVEFSQRQESAPAPGPEPQPDDVILGQIPQALRFYFEADTTDPDDRRAYAQQYMDACAELLAEFEGQIVRSVSPEPALLAADPEAGVIFDPDVPADRQNQLLCQNEHLMDSQFKLVAAMDEKALVLSAVMPDSRFDEGGTPVPIFYIMTYPTRDVRSDAYAFIRGRILSFAQLEEHKVYSEGQYTCYEVSAYFYSDLTEHVRACVDSHARLDEAAWQRLWNIYDYYNANLSRLLGYAPA